MYSTPLHAYTTSKMIRTNIITDHANYNEISLNPSIVYQGSVKANGGRTCYCTLLAGSHFVPNQELKMGLSVEHLVQDHIWLLPSSLTVGAIAMLLMWESNSPCLSRTPFIALLVHSHQAFSLFKSQRATSNPEDCRLTVKVLTNVTPSCFGKARKPKRV